MLDKTDRKILNHIQEGFLSLMPYQKLGKELGLDEAVVFNRVKKLKKKGFIRRIGALINHKKLAYYSTLIGLKVPQNKVGLIAEQIVQHSEVTHCYERKGDFNLWFTFIGPSLDKRKKFVEELELILGKENILNLPTKRNFKLKTKLLI